MLLGLTLLIMGVLVILALVAGGVFIGILSETTISNVVIIDGDPSTFEIATQTSYINIDILTMTLIIVITVAVIAAVIGIQILGSGLDSFSIRIILLVMVFVSIWILFSVITLNMLASILYFGWMIYVVLTIMYSYGVIQYISGGNSE